VHGVKCGIQIFTSGFVLTLKLLDVPIELALHSADLLLEQIGTLLQIATYVTHLMIPPTFNQRRSNDLAGQQFRLISSDPSITKRRDFSATQLGEAAQLMLLAPSGEKGAGEDGRRLKSVSVRSRPKQLSTLVPKRLQSGHSARHAD
jgi:hypothetical protein